MLKETSYGSFKKVAIWIIILKTTPHFVKKTTIIHIKKEKEKGGQIWNKHIWGNKVWV